MLIALQEAGPGGPARTRGVRPTISSESESRRHRLPHQVYLPPVPAVETVAAAFLPPLVRHPYRARPGRTLPAAFHPSPVAAAPVIVSLGPRVTRTGRYAHYRIPRRGWTIAYIVGASGWGAGCEHRADYHETASQELLSHFLSTS